MVVCTAEAGGDLPLRSVVSRYVAVPQRCRIRITRVYSRRWRPAQAVTAGAQCDTAGARAREEWVTQICKGRCLPSSLFAFCVAALLMQILSDLIHSDFLLLYQPRWCFGVLRLRFVGCSCSLTIEWLFTPPRQSGSGVLWSVCLCVCVCLSASISLEPLDRSLRIFCADPRGSVLLWRRCDTLCTSGFMDDVAFGRNGPYGDAWKAEPLTYYH